MSAPRQSSLRLDDPTRPVPTRPTWFHVVAGQEDRLSFDSLAELGRHIVRLTGRHGLRIAPSPATTCVCGLDPFPAWSIYQLGDDGGEDWMGHAAIQDVRRDQLEAAIDAARCGAGYARAA